MKTTYIMLALIICIGWPVAIWLKRRRLARENNTESGLTWWPRVGWFPVDPSWHSDFDLPARGTFEVFAFRVGPWALIVAVRSKL